MQQPAWLARAWAELGVAERSGASHNPRVVAYYRDAGHDEIRDDETAWCAAFLGAILERSGIASTRSLRARSYLEFGEALSEGRLGAIAVLSRGANPALGHVGFVVGETADSIVLLGGNQSDKVSVEAFDKDRLLQLRWPAAAAVAANPRVEVSAENVSPSVFEIALAHVLDMEGGWTEDPYDPGGPTNQGITLATYARHRGVSLDAQTTPGLKAELRRIPSAVVREIYTQRYWIPCRAEDLPAGLALLHFDAAVNHGVAGAARFLQQAVGTEVDGEIGPLTIAAARVAPQSIALAAYAELRRVRYRELTHFWRFGRGWLRRVDATLRLAKEIGGSGPLPAGSADTQVSTGKQGGVTMSTDADFPPGDDAKWWGESMTIWGVVVTTLATVLPVVGPLLGYDITSDLVHQIGEQATQVIQAVGGLVGTLMTIAGRARARTTLVRRRMLVKI